MTVVSRRRAVVAATSARHPPAPPVRHHHGPARPHFGREPADAFALSIGPRPIVGIRPRIEIQAEPWRADWAARIDRARMNDDPGARPPRPGLLGGEVRGRRHVGSRGWTTGFGKNIAWRAETN